MPLTWVNEVYRLQDLDEKDSAIDVLFERMDDYMLKGDWELCAQAMERFDLERLGVVLIIALLSITSGAREHLPCRSQVVELARKRLEVLAPDRVESLLLGLV